MKVSIRKVFESKVIEKFEYKRQMFDLAKFQFYNNLSGAPEHK